jgi:MiaB-like tRNA modifying enzyme
VDFKTFHIKTLGCKINQYETQAINELLQQQGKTPVPLEEAELVIFNSCAVTQRAISDLKKQIKGVLKHLSPSTQILVTGCAAQVLKEKISRWKGVQLVIPQEQKLSFFAQEKQPFSFPPINNYFRARAILKIQDGCSHRCTYCIVPLTRGKSRSRNPREILAELKRLVEAGFQEVILSGINLRQYGRDLTEVKNFWELILFLKQHFDFIKHKVRLRISSLEPKDLDQRALDVLGESPFICPHLHISLQSGSDKILKLMGRGHYKAEDLERFIEQIKTIWPVFGLGLDLLVGFPGEKEEDFLATYNLVKRLPLSYAHVFPYSPRPNTPAATFSQQLPPAIKKERAKKLRDLVEEKKQLFLHKLLKLPSLQVIKENEYSGTSEYYQQVFFSTSLSLANKKLIQVRPWQVQDNKLFVLPL